MGVFPYRLEVGDTSAIRHLQSHYELLKVVVRGHQSGRKVRDSSGSLSSAVAGDLGSCVFWIPHDPPGVSSS